MPTIEIYNGKEVIAVRKVIQTDDAGLFRAELPVFNSALLFRRSADTLEGQWHNYNKDNYSLPFKAIRGVKERFLATTTPQTTLAPRWKVTFSPGQEDAYPAIGKFEMDATGYTTGTFLTETGDYRFLAGHFDGARLQLSCFDGAHAFLFDARLQKDGQLMGTFFSGNHWQEPWIATPDETYQLADMQTLTTLKEGYTSLSFRFPNIEGDTIQYDSTDFQGKVTIVEISGSWCPNCMDASRFLQSLYEEYQSEGLEVLALDYELVDDFEKFQENERRLRQDLSLTYPVLFGGKASKTEAAQTLPMLNHIMSYPTLVFIGKDGEVRSIHTGFSGPGTGEEYDNYVQQTRQLVQRLLRE